MKTLRSTANVVVDGLAYLGPLSYSIPEGVDVRPGDAVEVPVGKRTTAGLVIGPGDPSKATREIICRYGERTTAVELKTAELVATEQATQLQQMVARLAPKSGKGADPAAVGGKFKPVSLPEFSTKHHADKKQRLLLLYAPAVRPEELAVAEAARLAGRGQVLILCPTSALVERVLGKVSAGIVRLDAKAKPGEWAAFRNGVAPVAVGTRAAAWYAPEKLGAIIVVDENNPAHREQKAPRHHARDVAIARAKASGVPLVMLSTNPTPSAMGSGVQVYPVKPAGSSGWPRMVVHDESKDAVSSPDLPFEVAAELETTAERALTKPLVVVSGRSSRRCVQCFAERTKAMSARDRCPECGEVASRVVGFDKDRINEHFHGAVEPVLASELDQYRDAGLVVITDVMPLLARPELNPYKHAVDVFLDSAAAAGAGGKVVAVTRDASHPVLRLLFDHQDQLGIAKRSYRTAQRLQLPPFGKMVSLEINQKSLPDMSGWPGHVHGPMRVKGGWEFIIRCQNADLPQVRREVRKLRKKKVKIRYHVD